MTLLLLFNAASSGSATGTAFRSFVEAGMFLGNWSIDDYLTFTAQTHDDTGAVIDADSAPAYAIYEDETGTPIVTGTMAQLGGVTGFYSERLQLTAAAGFEVGKCYTIRVGATVDSVDAAAMHVFAMNRPAVDVQEWLGATADALLTAQNIRDAMKLAPTAGDPTAGSVDKHLDDLAAALAAATVSLTVVSAVSGDEINVYQAVSLAATITGLAIPAGWTKIYWTVKRSTSEADADAIIQMVETNPGAGTDGLLRLNGAAGTAANGSLTVDQAAGTVVIALDDGTTDDLSLATGLVWSLKALYSTSSSSLLATGTLNVLSQATLAVA